MRNSFKPDEDGIKNILTLLVLYEIKKPTKLFTKYLIRTKIQIPLDVCQALLRVALDADNMKFLYFYYNNINSRYVVNFLQEKDN